MLWYGTGKMKWTKEEMQKSDRKTGKTIEMKCGTLHPECDVLGLYLPRNMGGRGFIECKECIQVRRRI